MQEQTEGAPEYKPSRETRAVLLAAGKYFVFGKPANSNAAPISVGLGYDRYCRSKYNAFSGE